MQLKNLTTNFLGRNCIYYKQISSTQTKLLELIQNNQIPNGTLIIADIQTLAVGTHGRTWYTDEENNIAFSFYIKTNCDIEKLEGLTLQIAQILVCIFQKKYQITLTIKKPNDLMLHNKKVGGILTQTKTAGKIAKYIVVGIGINTTKQHFTKEIENIATSIQKECNIQVEAIDIISEFCNQLEKQLLQKLEEEKV